MTTQNTKSSRRPAGVLAPEGPPEDVVDRLEGLLSREELERALEGLDPGEITGPGGLLTQLAGRVLDTALGAELSEHLGYPPGEAPPGGAGNVRDGSTPKTVQSELGPVSVNTPRDRQGSFAPQLVRKRQTRLAGLDDRVLDSTPAACRSATSPLISAASTAPRWVATPSAGSPTRCSRMSRPGARGHLRWSTRSSTSTR